MSSSEGLELDLGLFVFLFTDSVIDIRAVDYGAWSLDAACVAQGIHTS